MADYQQEMHFFRFNKKKSDTLYSATGFWGLRAKK